MTDYKQNSGPWANLIYDKDSKGNPLIYKSDACFVTSLGNLVDKNPADTAELLRNGGGLVNGLIQSEKAAQILGLEYLGTSKTKPNYATIAETGYFAPKSPQHFFIVKEDGSILDPLGLHSSYPIVSYRLFKRKESMAGKLYENSSGQVWISYNGKRFYVEAPQDFAGENIINSDDIPGVVMIKQSDQDIRLQQQKDEYEAKIKAIQDKPPVEVIKEVDSAETLKKLKEANDNFVKVTGQLDACKKAQIAPQSQFSLQSIVDWFKGLFNKGK
jgi:hypothetical protein